MAARPKVFRPNCMPERTKADRDREADKRRGSARSRGYDGAWSKAARGFRRSHPLCQYCEAGAFGVVRVAAADLVDHLYPHRGDSVLFWRSELWVACCTECHNGPKQAAERKGLAALDRLARLLGRPLLAEGRGVAKV